MAFGRQKDDLDSEGRYLVEDLAVTESFSAKKALQKALNEGAAAGHSLESIVRTEKFLLVVWDRGA